MRSNVVLPHPEGPRSTRNSPSLLARSMPSTAGGFSPNCLVRFRTSTVAIGNVFHHSLSRLEVPSSPDPFSLARETGDSLQGSDENNRSFLYQRAVRSLYLAREREAQSAG